MAVKYVWARPVTASDSGGDILFTMDGGLTHGFSEEDTVRFIAGTFPTGISANTDYYVQSQSTTTFKVSTTTPTGTPVSWTNAGSDVSVSIGDDAATYGGSAAAPFATLKYAIENANGFGGAPANGDVVYIDRTHVENMKAASYTIEFLSSNTNWDQEGGPLYLVSTDFTDSGNETEYAAATSGLISNTGANWLSFNASAADSGTEPAMAIEWHGINLGCPNIIYFNDGIDHKFVECDIDISSGSSFSCLRTSSGPLYLTFQQCEFDFNSSNVVTGFYLVHAVDTRIVLDDCTFANLGASPSSAFINTATNHGPNATQYFEIRGSDISGVRPLVDINSKPMRCQLVVENCLTHDTFANMVTNGDIADAASFTNGLDAMFVASSNSAITATPPGLSFYKSSGGEAQQNTTVYFTANPANNGEDDFSWKLDTNADTNVRRSVGDAVRLSTWHPGGDKTLTVRFADDDTANGTLKDDEVWVEVHSPGHTTDTGSATVGRYVNTRADFNKGVDAGTSSFLKTDTDASWTDGGGTLSANEYKFEVGVNATEPGTLTVKFVMTKPGPDTYYLNPKLELA